MRTYLLVQETKKRWVRPLGQKDSPGEGNGVTKSWTQLKQLNIHTQQVQNWLNLRTFGGGHTLSGFCSVAFRMIEVGLHQQNCSSRLVISMFSFVS